MNLPTLVARALAVVNTWWELDSVCGWKWARVCALIDAGPRSTAVGRSRCTCSNPPQTSTLEAQLLTSVYSSPLPRPLGFIVDEDETSSRKRSKKKKRRKHRGSDEEGSSRKRRKDSDDGKLAVHPCGIGAPSKDANARPPNSALTRCRSTDDGDLDEDDLALLEENTGVKLTGRSKVRLPSLLPPQHLS